MAGAEKISFESGGDFIRETRREVEAYLASRSTRRAGYARLYAKVPVAIGLTAISWSLLLVGPSHLVLIAACFAGLVLGAVLTGFCVQHDANHGAFFRRTRYNHLVGWTSDALLGVSSYAWRVRHNVAHHTYTNIDGHDADITQMPVASWSLRNRRDRGIAFSTSTSGRSTASWACACRRSATSRPSVAATSEAAPCTCRAAGISPGFIVGKLSSSPGRS